MTLADWIDTHYLDSKQIKRLRLVFHSQRPFSFIELKGFFKQDIARRVLEQLSKEPFYSKEADLFKMMQTNDLVSSKNVFLQKFRSFLKSRDFLKYIQQISDTKLNGGIDSNGSLYQSTDYLLCHDDRLQGRKVAFFYYLTNMKKSDGGRLQFFSSKNKKPIRVVKSIIPKFNTFAFFIVSDRSFHQVEEVQSNKRLTLSGWFHG